MENLRDTDSLETTRLETDRMTELSQTVAIVPERNVRTVAAETASFETDDDGIELGPKERLGRSLQVKREELAMGLEEIARITRIPKASLGHIEAGRFGSLPGDVFARGFLRSYARCLDLDGDDVVRRYAQCGLIPAPVSSELADAVLGGRRKHAARRPRGTAPVNNASTRTAPVGTAPAAGTGSEPVADAFSLATGPSEKQQSTDTNVVRNVLRDAFDLRLQLRSDRNSSKKKSVATRQENESAQAEPSAECKTTHERRTRTFIPPCLPSDTDMTHRGPLTLGVIILVIVATLTMSYLLRRPGTSTDGFTMNSPTLLDGQGGAGQLAPSTHPSHFGLG